MIVPRHKKERRGLLQKTFNRDRSRILIFGQLVGTTLLGLLTENQNVIHALLYPFLLVPMLVAVAAAPLRYPRAIMTVMMAILLLAVVDRIMQSAAA